MHNHIFEPSQLTLLRELEGITKASLANELGVTPATITGWENGARNPSPSNIARLSFRFAVEPEFFSFLDTFKSPDLPFFRSLRSTTVAERTKSNAYVDVVERIIRALEKNVNFPSYDEFTLDGSQSPEDVALQIRKALGLGLHPIPNLLELIENAGIFVVFGPGSSNSVDAFSKITQPNPVVVLNPSKNDYYRQRFDLAHELGHIVLHSGDQVGEKAIEVEANRFAGEFLAPTKLIAENLPHKLDQSGLNQLRILKERWGISMQALLYRAHSLGTMDDRSYKNAMMTFSKRGWRRSEPGNRVVLEAPTLLPSAMTLLNNAGYDLSQIAREAGVPTRVLQQVARYTPFPKMAKPTFQ
ncbi:XRE family transcriptional regulator [Corynebacterium gottingense]|uniref:ImmA/IrrE family metallo-endopeptidase n=1 Tax=Corynebacterium gottingense TaxID=2041036 RepID=A0ABX9UJU6_9CORY|nr:XRE family transcriptional regulator [Corynebacterium gottingense]RMD19025.1 ImmA/IrrE family metallo-endopeptidase [Corynebacterium gottingense]WJZ14239.1 Helix-turn-helix protein [Corynebacterium gottingense]WJZ16552.1 Helix-turn-helix protein [Corynebacterium gottingense]